MRRIVALFLFPLIAGLALVGCGSSKPPSANGPCPPPASLALAPKVTIPKEKASSTLAVKTLVQGKGAAITKSNLFLSNFTIYVWSGKTNKLLDSTYSSSPQVLPASLLPGIESAVTGKKLGSRVLAVIPPKQGYGTSGNSQLGVTGTDTLVFVIDLIQKYNSGTVGATGAQTSNGGGSLPAVSAAKNAAPTITIPKNVTAPKTLVTKTLIKGTGPVVTKGQDVVAQYTGVIWRTGQGVRLVLVTRACPTASRSAPTRARSSRAGTRAWSARPWAAGCCWSSRPRTATAAQAGRPASRAPTTWSSWSTSWGRSPPARRADGTSRNGPSGAGFGCGRTVRPGRASG